MNAHRDYSIKRIIRKLLLMISESQFIPGQLRPRILSLGGVQVHNAYIGSRVILDAIHPELITIGDGTTITSGTRILTHFYNPVNGLYSLDKVVIGRNCFIGMNTIICKPVIIGDNSVIGAGSIVTKDIPSGEVWAGNPAKFIKKVAKSNS